VPGHLATTIDVEYFCAIGRTLRFLGALSGGIGTNVLKQNAGIRSDSLNYLFVNSSLKRKPFKVGHKIGIQSCG
jgi:hypothetical protein